MLDLANWGVARQFLEKDDVNVFPKAYSNYIVDVGSLEFQDIINRMEDDCMAIWFATITL